MPIFPFSPFYPNYYSHYCPHYYTNNGDIQNSSNNNPNNDNKREIKESKEQKGNEGSNKYNNKRTSKNNSFANINLSALLDSDLNIPIVEILGIKLFLDDLIIIGLLFFLYKEDVQDEILFGILLLLLLS